MNSLNAAWSRIQRSTPLLVGCLLLWALIGGYVLLIGSVNLLLAVGGPGRLIASQTDDLRIEVDGAYMLWPGRVHFKHVDLELHDTSVHARFQIARGSVTLDPMALLSMRFVGSDLHAYGVHATMRTLPAGLSSAHQATLPDLSPPKLPHGITDPKTLWGIDLRLAEVVTEEVWINEARQLGSLTIRGGFYLQPMRHLEIYPSQVDSGDSHALSVGIGKQIVLDDTQISLEPTLPETDVSGDVLTSLLKQLELQGSVHGRVTDLAPFSQFLGAIKLSGGAGPLDLRLDLSQGFAGKATRLTYLAPEVRLARRDLEGVGTLHVNANTEGLSQAVTTEVHVHSLTIKQRGKSVGSVKRVNAQLVTANQLRPIELERGSVSVSNARMADVSPLESLLPKSLKPVRGSLKFNASASYRNRVVEAALKARWRKAQLTLSDMQLDGEVWLKTVLRSQLPFKRAKVTSLSLDLRRAALGSSSTEPAPRFELKLRGNALELSRSDRSASGALKLTVSDTTALERAAGVEPPALLASLFGLADLDLLTSVELSPTRQQVHILGGRSGGAELSGRLRHQADGLTGAVLIKNGILSVGVSARKSDIGIHPLVGSDWLQEQLVAMR